MKRWKLGVLACLVAVSLSALLVGCQSQSYTPAGKDPVVADSSLVKGGVLRVGVNAASAPLAGQTSSSSRIVGIDVDVAAYLADELGLKVEIVDVGTDPASALEEGTVDVALGVDASTDSDMDCWRSSAYLKTGVALFGAKDESSVPTVDSKPKVGAQASSKSSWRVTNLFGDDSLVTENDLKSAFESLGKGSVDYVAADAVIGIRENGLFFNGISHCSRKLFCVRQIRIKIQSGKMIIPAEVSIKAALSSFEALFLNLNYSFADHFLHFLSKKYLRLDFNIKKCYHQCIIIHFRL